MKPLTHGTVTGLASALLALFPAFAGESTDDAERVTWAETSQTLVAEEEGATSEEQADPAESEGEAIMLDPKEDPAAKPGEGEGEDDEDNDDDGGAL